MSRARSFCFTINNWTEDDIAFLDSLECKYLIYGKEIGDSGTPHLQCYVTFNNAKSVKGIVKVLRGHISVAKGNAKQNIDYCSKDGDFVERGDRPAQGKRSDIDVVKDLVNSGASMAVIVDECASFQALRFAEKMKEYKEPKRNWVPNVYWFWGSTGTGKTKTATEMFPDAWISGKNLKWWQGYDAHSDVIIDDFRCDFCTFHELLRILDRYSYTVEVKGGSRQLLAKNIVITAPKPPRDMFEHRVCEDLAQLERRITEIRYFGTNVSGTEVGGNNSSPTPSLTASQDLDAKLQFLYNV